MGRIEIVEQLIEKYGIAGNAYEVANISTSYPRKLNRCYEVCLIREKIREYLYVCTGKGILEMSLAEALYNLVDSAEKYNGWEPFEEWNRQNDEGYYERELGKEGAKHYYNYSKETYQGLVKVLGETIYEELEKAIR